MRSRKYDGERRGEGVGAQQYNPELPCPPPPKLLLQPFMTQYSTMQLLVAGLHTTVTTPPFLTSDHRLKSWSRFCKTRLQLFCPLKKPHFLHMNSVLVLPLNCQMWYMMWRSPKVRTLVAQFRNLYCSILPQFTGDQTKALSRGQEWGTRGF